PRRRSPAKRRRRESRARPTRPTVASRTSGRRSTPDRRAGRAAGRRARESGASASCEHPHELHLAAELDLRHELCAEELEPTLAQSLEIRLQLLARAEHRLAEPVLLDDAVAPAARQRDQQVTAGSQ